MSRFEDIDFRDAHVSWQESESCYWMLVATRLRTGAFWTRGCLALFTSPDFEVWTVDPKRFYAPNDMFCPECPELFSLPNGKHYLVYSRFHAPDAGTVYRVADSPRGPFRTPRASSGGRFDARRWYAAKSCPKAGDPSKRIYFGWVADKLDGQWSWGGDMAMPREVFADENGHLVVHPCPEILSATFAPGFGSRYLPPFRSIAQPRLRAPPYLSRSLSRTSITWSSRLLPMMRHLLDYFSAHLRTWTDIDSGSHRLVRICATLC